MTVEKVGNIDNSKFLVQTKQSAPAQEKPVEKEPEKEIDWVKWGSIGTIAAAAIIGGIYYLKSGKAPEVTKNLGHELNTGSNSTLDKKIDEVVTGTVEIVTKPVVIDDPVLLDIAKKLGKPVEEIKAITEADEFKNIIEQAQLFRGTSEYITSQVIVNNLNESFGEDAYKLILKNSQLDFANQNSSVFDILNNNRTTFNGNFNAIAFFPDANGQIIKCKDGIYLKLQKHEISDGKIKTTNLPVKIISDRNGEHIHLFHKNEYDMNIIRPKEITETNPKITSFVGEKGAASGLFELREYKDRNVLITGPKSQRLTIEFNPETKQPYMDGCSLIFGDNRSTNLNKKQNVLSEIAETFDFTKITEKEHIDTLNALIAKLSDNIFPHQIN